MILFLLLICRVLEVLNYMLILRWLTNIKIDIIKYICLIKQKNVYIQKQNQGIEEIIVKEGVQLGDCIDLQDFDLFNIAV